MSNQGIGYQDIYQQLYSFGYTHNEIKNAIQHVTNSLDINEIIDYISNQQLMVCHSQKIIPESMQIKNNTINFFHYFLHFSFVGQDLYLCFHLKYKVSFCFNGVAARAIVNYSVHSTKRIY